MDLFYLDIIKGLGYLLIALSLLFCSLCCCWKFIEAITNNTAELNAFGMYVGSSDDHSIIESGVFVPSSITYLCGRSYSISNVMNKMSSVEMEKSNRLITSQSSIDLDSDSSCDFVNSIYEPAHTEEHTLLY